MDKRGILGLDTARGFILFVLVVAVIGFVVIIALAELNTVSDSVLPTRTAKFVNITTAAVVTEYPGALVTGFTEAHGYRKCVLTVTTALNATDDVVVDPTNITTSGCYVQYAGHSDASGFNGSSWKITGSIDYTEPQASSVLENVSLGTSEFFSDATTWFTLLSVVVIILIIGVVIWAVSRFGGGAAIRTEGETGDLL